MFSLLSAIELGSYVVTGVPVSEVVTRLGPENFMSITEVAMLHPDIDLEATAWITLMANMNQIPRPLRLLRPILWWLPK